MPKYVNYNGVNYDVNEPVLRSGNRGIFWGDALVEVIHANGKRPIFIEEHMERLRTSMHVLGYDIPPVFFNTHLGIKNEIYRTLHRNRYHKSTKVKLLVFKEGSTMLSTNEDTEYQTSYLIETTPLEKDFFHYEEELKRYNIDIYSKNMAAITEPSFLLTNSNLLFVLADLYRKEFKLEDLIIINTDGFVIGGIWANIFAFFKEKNLLITPPTNIGAIDGIIRRKILDIAAKHGIDYDDSTPFMPALLKQADEVWMTNTIYGLQPVRLFKEKLYTNDKAVKFALELNRLAFPDSFPR